MAKKDLKKLVEDWADVIGDAMRLQSDEEDEPRCKHCNHKLSLKNEAFSLLYQILSAMAVEIEDNKKEWKKTNTT